MTDPAHTRLGGNGVRVDVHFDTAPGAPLQVRYTVHNTGHQDLAVFDRGNQHAVLTGRQARGDVGAPGFRDEGQGDGTLSHVALPLAQPSPTLPPVPLAARVPAGQSLQGAFAFSPLLDQAPVRLRWCLGVADFDPAHFSSPTQAGAVEVWQGAFTLADAQQVLCTPWFEVAAGAFVSGD